MTLVEPVRSAVLELTLTACHGRETAEDVHIEVPRDMTVGALATALARHIGVVDPHADTDLALYSARAGWLDNAAFVTDVDLRMGDRVEVTAGRSFGRLPADGRPAPGGGIVELVVTGGPESGRRISLLPGRHSVGRDAACDVMIDDPSISRSHLIVEVRAGGTTVSDAGSRNGTAIEGVRLGAGDRRLLADGQQVELGRTLFTVTPPTRPTGGILAGPDATVLFNRPPRIARPYEAPGYELPGPPREAQRARFPLGAALLPLVLGVAFALLIHQMAMLLFAALSPAMIIWNTISDRRSGRAEYVRGAKEFRARLAAVEAELEEARHTEVFERRRASPDAGDLVARATGHLPSLWERRRTDADFLHVRVGTADQPSAVTVSLDAGGSAELRGEAEPLVAPASVPAVPAVVALGEVGTLGLWGARERSIALARWILIQIAALHSPRDVVLAACVPPVDEPAWAWLKWLPHRDGDALGVDAPLLASRESDARGLMRAATAVVLERVTLTQERFGPRIRDLGPAVVLLIDDRVALDRAQVARLLEEGPAVGVHVIWVGEAERDLPGGCGALAQLTQDVARLDLVDVASGTVLPDVAAEGVDRALAEDVARALAPVRDIGATGTRSDVPKRVALPSLLDIEHGSAAEIRARWAAAAGDLTVPIGVGAGSSMTIDLRHDGPHALIAGTTGAGKSELLQTLVIALAATLPPDRLSFLLIDYKGGAAFQELAALPHAVGNVTDLDEHLTHRALLSLNAELKRREEILARAGAKDLLDMLQRAPAEAPATLVIVIDEFATLAKDVPDFVDGVVDVAQRGRSLGVHLVLATQRPSGVVNENIRANTNLRIALRVASDQDSEDVIGARDSARIPRSLPGRGMARTGHEELTAFQTAFVGGRSLTGSAAPQVAIRKFGFGLDAVAPGSVDGTDADDGNDLRTLVTAVAEATREAGVQVPPAPWLDPLAPVVALDALVPAAGGDEIAVCGVVDEPARQRQRPLELDLATSGSVLIYGTSGAGKTAALRTIAASLAMQAPPEALQFYGLDCGTRALAGLDVLPHCGTVVTVDDGDRVRRLLLMLRREIDERQALFAREGAFTLADMRRLVPGAAPPRIVLLLDSYGGFTAAYERVDNGELVDLLPRLIADGRAAGVHVIATADRRNAVPPATTSIVPTRLVLRMASEDEYSALGLDPRLTRGAVLPPGRGFFGSDEVQMAMIGADPSAEGQATALAALAEKLRARHGARVAPALQPLPSFVARDDVPSATDPWSAAVGIDDQRLAPVELTLRDGHLLVAGSYRSGRSTALGTIAAQVRATTPGVRCLLIAVRRSPLVHEDGWDAVARSEEDASTLLAELTAELAASASGAAPVLLVLDDAPDLADTAADPLLGPLIRRARDGHVRIAAAFESSALRVAYHPWMKELKKDGQGILLDPNQDLDGDIFGVRLPRRSSTAYPAGRGYAVRNGGVTLLHVAS